MARRDPFTSAGRSEAVLDARRGRLWRSDGGEEAGDGRASVLRCSGVCNELLDGWACKLWCSEDGKEVVDGRVSRL